MSSTDNYRQAIRVDGEYRPTAGRPTDRMTTTTDTTPGPTNAGQEYLDRWRATDVRVAGRAHLDDLRRSAVAAQDWRALVTCTRAILPMEQGWPPRTDELDALRACTGAWNQRAARLRRSGVDPVGESTDDEVGRETPRT